MAIRYQDLGDDGYPHMDRDKEIIRALFMCDEQALRCYNFTSDPIRFYDAQLEFDQARKRPHTHTGVDDAEEQMQLFFNLMDKK